MMGRDDVEKMIRQAYQKAGESGMGAGQQGMSQEVAIAVSRGEVTIPPHIAKIIGYDRLKKDKQSRQERSFTPPTRTTSKPQGVALFLEKKLAKGDRVTVYRGEPLDPSKVTQLTMAYGKENVGKYHTPTDVKKGRSFCSRIGQGQSR